MADSRDAELEAFEQAMGITSPEKLQGHTDAQSEAPGAEPSTLLEELKDTPVQQEFGSAKEQQCAGDVDSWPGGIFLQEPDIPQSNAVTLALQAARDSTTIMGNVMLSIFEMMRPMFLQGQGGATPQQSSFEMRQTAKGQNVFDVKIYIQPGETEEDALARFDKLNAELSKRARTGE